MNSLVVSTITQEEDTSFASGKEWLTIIILALIGLYWNYIPYSNMISITMQTVLLGLIFVLYRKKPVMFMVSYILLTILPTRIYGGFMESAQNYYTLNPKICIAGSLLFFIFGLAFLKRNFTIKFSILLFVTLMMTSLVWTISSFAYDMDFWWMLTAYLLFPMFIQTDHDLRLILTAYIVAVDVFCLNILPLLVTGTNLYRGIIRLDPNYAAFFVIISIAIILIILTSYKAELSKQFTAFLFASGMLSVISMAYFTSRTAFVMLAFLAVAYLFFNSKKLNTMVISLISIVILYFLFNHFGLFDATILRFTEPNIVTAGGRFEIQLALLSSFNEFGIGQIILGNGYLTISYFGMGYQAHNSYISILIGFGLLGLSIYCFYLYEIFRTLYSSTYKPFLIMFYLLCLYGFSLEPYLIIEGILLFCVLSGISNIIRTNNEQPDNTKDEIDLKI